MNWVGAFSGSSAVLLWAITPVIFKLGMESIPLSYLLVLRFSVAVLLLLPFLPNLIKKRAGISMIDLLSLQIILAGALFSMGTALKSLSASFYIIVFSLSPILTLFLFRSVRLVKIIGPVLIMAIGTLVFVETTELSKHSDIGDIAWLLLGMLLWVLYTRFLSRLHTVCSDVDITTLTNLLCLIGSIIWWGCEKFSVVPLSGLTFSIAAISGILSPIAFFAFSLGMRKSPIWTIAVQYLDPAFGVLAAWLLLGERVHPFQIAGVFVTTLGLIWLGQIKAKSNVIIGGAQ